MRTRRLIAALLGAILLPAAALAADHPSYGPELEGFDYPHEVRRFELVSQGQRLAMAYIDVAPARPNGRTVVLLHGKNFCAATYEGVIRALTGAGYRTIAVDQIGFCKSSKPEGYQFSFAQLAANTHALLESLGVRKAAILGHSMGGMLAARYALSYPEATERLVMVNPLGLEDWKAEGVPYATIDALHANELKTSFDTVKAYQTKFYYGGEWKPAYDRWVEMNAGMYAGPGRDRIAWIGARTSEMIYAQPVVYEFPRIAVPTTLMIGQDDRTAPGANRAAPEVAKRLGDYPALGRRAAASIPGAKLVEFPGLGHAPQIEDPETFEAALLKALAQ
ncbi:alpha/beta fold hydrolase [Hansschlegelia beijingensis]|uniref:Pimeloyl-ACP methyl ester carboxylesterase n=1 Tax=Hansschlegelia beijingensis TaxID=1133344 RepID=A0A7W6GEJ5_9HYPH|nr:alpha/beta hydrolase [Hansschlegelia beijingensis]MBB3972961.1 pimeloyl-ACP methyl ester carboxylesterase [Hansschlegelia beijingensis]